MIKLIRITNLFFVCSMTFALFASGDPFEGWTHEFVEQCLATMPDVRDKEQLDNYGCNQKDTGDWGKSEIYMNEPSPLNYNNLFSQIDLIIEQYKSKHESTFFKGYKEDVETKITRYKDPAYIIGAKKSSDQHIISFADNHGGFRTFIDYFMERTNNNFCIKDEYKNEQYIFLGDIIHRGPASLASLLFHFGD